MKARLRTNRRRCHSSLPLEMLEPRIMLTHPIALRPGIFLDTDTPPQVVGPISIIKSPDVAAFSGNPLSMKSGNGNSGNDEHGDQHDGSPKAYLDGNWIKERESIHPNQTNNSSETAQHLNNIGTLPGNDSRIGILGSLGVTAKEIQNREDDGSIPTANPTGLAANKDGAIIARGRIGDGPHGNEGTGAGDYDYYKFSARAGQLVSINVEAESINTDFVNPVVALYDSSGNLVTYNNDQDYLGLYYGQVFGYYNFRHAHFDSAFRFQVPQDGDYFAVVFSSYYFQVSPFDSGSGGGDITEGDYLLSITKESPTLISTLGEDAANEDGAIPFATDTGIQAGEEGYIYAAGYIGDGLHGFSGGATGDYDMYRFDALQGQQIYLSADTDPRLSSFIVFDEFNNIYSVGMDTLLRLYDAAGNLIKANDDYGSLDAMIDITAPYSGTYYVSVSGFAGGAFGTDLYNQNNFLADPFDPASGGAAGLEGSYNLLIRTESALETDTYSVDLQVGDILSIGAAGGVNTVQLFDPHGIQLEVTYEKLSIYGVAESPTIETGDAAFNRVITEAGRYTIVVLSADLSTDTVLPWLAHFAPYNLEVRVNRPGIEAEPVYTHQVIFLDFERSNASDYAVNDSFPGYLKPEVEIVSGLADHISRFDLEASDYDLLVDGILDVVQELLVRDVGGAAGRGLNGEFLVSGIAGEYQIEILNSRDHKDPYGVYPNVSRVFVGASTEELDASVLGFLGVAQHIDAGNYDMDDQAIVVAGTMVDALNHALNIGRLIIDPSSSRLELLTAALGNVIIHEIAHNIGAWHTNPIDNRPEMMDSGGDFFVNALGIGPDRVFGSADDVRVEFTSDSVFSPFEFAGTSVNDTMNTLAFGLSTGTQAGTYFDFVTGTLYITGEYDDGHRDRVKIKSVDDVVNVFINGELVLSRPAEGISQVVFNGSSDRDEFDASQYNGPTIQYGRGGRDTLEGGPSQDLLIGGSDHDELTGNGGPDILVGGDGNDLMFGGLGADLLIGGLGQDELFGGGIGDLLIGGTTAFDDDEIALEAIFSEWSSSRSYETRIQNLSGTGTADRSNFDYFLKASGSHATVFDDNAKDQLYGGQGRDWFFASLTGSRKDKLHGVSYREWIESLS